MAMADSPSDTDRKSGMAKNKPACKRYWKKNAVRPPRRTGFSKMAGLMSGSAPRASCRFSQPMKHPEHGSTGEDQPDRRGQPEPFRSRRLRLDQAPLSRPQDPVDDEAEAERRQAGPDEVEPDPLLGLGVGHPAGEDEDHGDDEDLTGEDPTPRGSRW